MQGLERRLAKKRDLQEIVVVEQPRRFDDRLFLGQRQSGDQQGLRCGPERERCTRGALTDRVSQPPGGCFDRRMPRRIHAPVADTRASARASVMDCRMSSAESAGAGRDI